jgi:hypothetical protein
MAKYKIWDKTETIYTIVGEKLTAEQWLNRYPWAEIPGVKMIIGGGTINGSVAMEFEATKDFYKKNFSADFSDCTTDEEVLAKMEDIDNNPPTSDTPTTEERTAAALEFLAVSSLPDTTDTTA